MKKKIIILAVLISLGSSGLFAQKNFWGFDSKGASFAMDIVCIVLGGGAAAVPLFDAEMSEPPYNYCLYGFGGTIALIGVIGLIYDAATPDSDYYAMEKNPILEHAVLNVAPKRLFVGGIWRF